ncbi:peptidoglycan-binding protein LysM [Tateyamaria sp.]|uniref:peptidoglycan-binding protein LysM n=1 Tax=Tateyamaria sp. TaxID=1929288 RepID=UPI003B222192
MKRFWTALGLAVLGTSTPALAQSCGGTYVVAPGDSLSVIADTLYKDAGKWTAIHQANITAIGENPNAIGVGQSLSINCIDGLPTGLDGAPLVIRATARAPEPRRTASQAKIKLITGDDFAPFTDRGLENGGLLADVVNVAMQAATGADGYDIHWINDWSAHLTPLLTEEMADMSFPWARPDCEGEPDQDRCVNFHYSKPMFEYLILLFVDKDRPVVFAQDSDLEGRTLCRPEAYTTHMLDQNGRNWVRDGKVTLKCSGSDVI